MTVQEAIAYIESVSWKGSIPGLGRTQTLLAKMGNPEKKLKFVHIAGTNGKGSTAAMTASILTQAGYKTGLYISPFIEVFNERIEAGGTYISDEDLAKYTDRVLEQVKVMTDAGHQSPTEFEVITAVAFLYYKEVGCDFVSSFEEVVCKVAAEDDDEVVYEQDAPVGQCVTAEVPVCYA